jgi:hypothetical protein
MYAYQRHTRAHVSDDSVMQDMMTETRHLCVSVLCAGASCMCVSHVVVATCAMTSAAHRYYTP